MNGLSFFDYPGSYLLGISVGNTIPSLSGILATCCSQNIHWKSRQVREWGVVAIASILCYTPMVAKGFVPEILAPFLASYTNDPSSISCFLTGIKVGIVYAFVLSMSTLGHLSKDGTSSYKFSTAIPAHIAGGGITYFVSSLLTKWTDDEAGSASIGFSFGTITSYFLGRQLIQEQN